MPVKGDRAEGRSPDPHERFMRLALEEARQGLHLGEVPIGAVLVLEDEVVGTGFNQPIHHVDPSAHAEVVALRRAARALGNYRLPGTTLYVTVEPCMMCVGALLHARVARVVYGCAEPKAGALASILKFETLPSNHRFEIVSGVLETECRRAIRDFFQYRREESQQW
jgi:tRNA(adenine34) deaminase